MVDVLVILDGASEPLGPRPTSLERARTPNLDRLGRAGAVSRLRTVAPWLGAGSEAAIPALLGWVPPAPVDRGALEAAARGIEPGPGERAWRVDAIAGRGGRAGEAETVAAAARLGAVSPAQRVHRIGGHRLLVVAVAPPVLPPASPEAAELRVWPTGVVPPRLLDEETVVVAAAGAAAGAGRLLGAAVVVPPGATGRPGTDLGAKADAALAAIAAGARRVVVHVGAADEAAHELDPAGKVEAIEAIDARLVAPLAAALRERGGTFTACPDHGCDPATGEHCGEPVPCLRWPAVDGPAGRMTEREVAFLPVVDPPVAVPA